MKFDVINDTTSKPIFNDSMIDRQKLAVRCVGFFVHRSP